jgi:hypothetical protein
MSKSILEMSTVMKLQHRIHTNRLRESRDGEVKRWVDRELRRHAAPIRRVSGENVFQNFILTYLKREKVKFQEAADSRQNPYGESRDRPLCTCNEDCPIKAADEPVEFKRRENLDAAIRAFKRRHPGHPIVLDDARDEWYEQVSDVEDLLRLLLNALIDNEIPTREDIAGSDNELLDALVLPESNDHDNDDDESDEDDGKADVDEAVSEIAARAGDD